MGLGVKGGRDVELVPGIRAVAQQQINLSALKEMVQISGFLDLFIGKIFKRTVQVVKFKIDFKTADILLCPFKNADGLSVEGVEVVAPDRFVVPPG